jgi:hypothetical protein
MLKNLLFIAYLFLSTNLIGQSVTAPQAAEIFKAFLQKNFARNSTQVIVSQEVFLNNGKPLIFAFNLQGGGFVIVAASNMQQPVLGYSETGSIDKNNLPPQLKAWLEVASDWIDKHPNEDFGLIQKALNPAFDLPTTTAVNPLCTTVWDQGCYYNEDCPSDAFGPCNHCVTGCVATAMAQVMKRWNYPQHGHGMHSYTHLVYGFLSADFGGANYNWSAMPDSLATNNPEVAQLMSHCGIAVNMDYSSTSSGSYISPAHFTQHFRYSLNAKLQYSGDFSIQSWIQLLKHELDEGRPILYSGMPAPPLPVGHAWVCDGYDNNDFFHFNWGWSGISNGYFQMGNFVYYLSNSAVTGLMPVQHNDICLTQLLNPVSASFTGPEVIRIKVANYDSVPHANIPLHYRVDNGTIVNAVMTDTIPAFSDKIFEFPQTWNFSGQPGHIYQVQVYATMPGDAYHGNDTLKIQVEDVVCSATPYTMGFEPGEPRTGWKVVNSNNDDYYWYYGGQGGHSGPNCVYMIAGGTQADDWMISKCISLESGKLYKLSFWHISGGTYPLQDFKVFLGNTNSIASLTTLLLDIQSNPSSGYILSETWFTVPATGSYYLGWYYHGSGGMASPVIDDISIEMMTSTDVGIQHGVAPTDGCDLQHEQVIINVRNYCSDILQNIPVGYSLDGGPLQMEVLPGPLSQGASTDYTFAALADLSAAGTHIIRILTNLPNDSLTANDTLTYTVTNHHSPALPYSMGFEDDEDFSEWTIENTNGDNYTWSYQQTGGHFGPRCVRYDYSSWIAANDWIFTKCIKMTAGNTYKLAFWEKIEDPNWPEKMSVYIGENPQSASMGQLLIDLPELSNTSWQSNQAFFTVPVTAYYYIGWKCYSDALMFNLYLDDISLIEYPSSVKDLVTGEQPLVFPNPAAGIFNIKLPVMPDAGFTTEVFDVLGNSVLSKANLKENTMALDLRTVKAGIYYLKLNLNGKETVIRLIKTSDY